MTNVHAQEHTLPQADGFRGVWYSIGPTGDEYRFKYSGGLATYPQQHAPMAVYSPEADKTFFVYGGDDGSGGVQHLVSYFDHATKQLARPRLLLDKDPAGNAHDNPVLSIDGDGHLWVFSNTHGNNRRSFIHKSIEPYAINRFEEVALPEDVFPEQRFSYAQPWFLPGESFLFVHIRYDGPKREVFWTRSRDGRTWDARRPLSVMSKGQYSISQPHGEVVGLVLDVHPVNVDTRTNLYYLQTSDGGDSWTTASKETVALPLRWIKKDPNSDYVNPALVHDYRSEGKLVYMKDLAFDGEGRPVILYLTCTTAAPGPAGGTRQLHTARFDGSRWVIRPCIETDHAYDHGSLYVENDGTEAGVWRVIGPHLPGPQAYGTGGEVGVWVSRDQGETWEHETQLTHNSDFNHTYVRKPVNAHDDFYALWADGDAFARSASSLYFTDRAGSAVWRMPKDVTHDHVDPQRLEGGERDTEPLSR